MPLKLANKINIYFPLKYKEVAIDTNDIRNNIGKLPLELSRIFEIIQNTAFVGQFGNYNNVCEISFGIEKFMPLANSNPVLGVAGESNEVDSMKITIYIFHDDFEEIKKFIDLIADIHPWEHPVIECVFKNTFYTWQP